MLYATLIVIVVGALLSVLILRFRRRASRNIYETTGQFRIRSKADWRRYDGAGK